MVVLDYIGPIPAGIFLVRERSRAVLSFVMGDLWF
jgi:hypothetical protein